MQMALQKKKENAVQKGFSFTVAVQHNLFKRVHFLSFCPTFQHPIPTTPLENNINRISRVRHTHLWR